MSAHVIAKGQVAAIQIASAISGEVDEDEKTTIESGWEEEPSTTVEQGELQAKLRAVGTGSPQQRTITGVTSTNATNLEEPTMDDQRANQALASVPVMTPSELIKPETLARLICTQGNDSGREYDIRPGKAYSIGRAIDNDVVLTDISVSRKHFDLRMEAGTWVLVDHGSGNGTLVNGNIEDAPFLLAGGDRIEIGNTSFRFDMPNAPAQPAKGARSADFEVELDAEPSVIHDGEGDSEVRETNSPDRIDARHLDRDSDGSTHRRLDDDEVDDEEEPSTVAGKPLREVAPEPAPERAYVPPIRPKTLPPPMPARQQQRGGSPAGYALGSQPMGAMGSVNNGATQPVGPNAMTVSPLQGMPPLQLNAPPAMPMSIPGAMPQSTLPLPQMANRPPPHMLDGFVPTTMPGQGAPQRSMPPSMPPPPMPAMSPQQQMQVQQMQMQQSMGYPQLQPHNELPAHVAPHMQMHPSQPQMVSYGLRGDSGQMAQSPSPYGAPMQASYVATPDRAGARRIKLVLGGVALTLLAAAATIVIIRHTSNPAPVDDPPAGSAVDPKAKVDPKTADQKHFTPPTPPMPQPPATQPHGTAPTVTPIAPAHTPTVTPIPPAIATTTQPTTTTAHPPVTQPPVTQPPVTQPHTVSPPPSTTTTTTTTTSPRDLTAAADALRRQAADLYRQRDFTKAAGVLRDGYKTWSTAERKNLPSLAKYYEYVGNGFANAGSSNAGDAFNALNMAIAADRNLDSAYVNELNPKLQAIAAKAALSFVVKNQLEFALSAVHVAESAGVGLETVSLVRKKLDQKAAEVYAKASAEKDSNPKDSKVLARKILNFVDSQSSWYAKAQALLST